VADRKCATSALQALELSSQLPFFSGFNFHEKWLL